MLLSPLFREALREEIKRQLGIQEQGRRSGPVQHGYRANLQWKIKADEHLDKAIRYAQQGKWKKSEKEAQEWAWYIAKIKPEATADPEHRSGLARKFAKVYLDYQQGNHDAIEAKLRGLQRETAYLQIRKP